MFKTNKKLFVDPAGVAFAEQGTETYLLESGHIGYEMCLPDANYMLPYPGVTTAKNFMENIKEFCKIGRSKKGEYLKKDCGNNHSPFVSHFANGTRMYNRSENFINYPMINYAMNLDFNCGDDLQRIIYNARTEELPKVDRLSYSTEQINYLRKPAHFKKLGPFEHHVSMAFAFVHCCDETPSIKKAYDDFTKRCKTAKNSFAEKLVFYQGYIVEKALPAYAFDNNLPLLTVSFNSNSYRKISTVPELYKHEVKQQCGMITDPFSDPYAMANSLVIASHVKNTQSILGHSIAENIEKEGLDAGQIKLIRDDLACFIKNYNKEYASFVPQSRPQPLSNPAA